MVLALINFQNLDLREILISLLVVTFSLSVHEYSHGRAAYALGDDTAKLQGRLTLNPLAHLDPLGVLCFILAHIGWAKPVPINPLRLKKAKSMQQGMMLVSLAGPASNLLISSLSAFFFQFGNLLFSRAAIFQRGAGQVAASTLMLLFANFFISNIYLAIFNMLPIPPLDGYKVFGALLPRKIYFQIMQFERYIGMAFMFLVMFGGNVLSRLMTTLASPVASLIMLPWQYLASLFIR